jgi:hypothetical protein
MEKILTDEQINALPEFEEVICACSDGGHNMDEILPFARAVEKAILESPVIKQAVEDSKRLQWFIDNEGTIQRYSNGKHQVFWYASNETKWYDNPRDAIDEAMKGGDE